MSRRHGRKFVSIIFSFLLAVVLTVIGLILVAQAAVREFSVNQVFNAEFMQAARNYIEETVSDYTLPTGIDLEVVDELFTEEKVKEDIRQAVSAAFSGTEFSPDLSGLRGELVRRVTELFLNSGMTGEDTSEIIETYADEIMDIYKDAFDVPGLSALTEMSRRYGTYLWIALIIAVIFALALIVICLRLHHWPHRGLRYVAYAAGGACLMTLAAPLALYITRLYEKLQITPQYVYICFMNYIRYILILLFVIAAFWLIVTIILAIAVGILRKKAVRRH